MRFRRIALRIGSAGLAIVPAVLLLVAKLGELTELTAVAAAVFLTILGGITLASLNNFHVRSVFNTGLMLLFVFFWIFSFAELFYGQFLPSRFALVLFVPIFITLALDYRLLAMLVPVQSVLIAIYVQQAGAGFFNAGVSGFDSVGLILAGLSGVLFAILALLGWVRHSTDEELLSAIRDKERLASTDPLTGLMNRRAFMEAMKCLWDREASFVIAFLDLDRFKPLNDQHGHAAGDAVLVQIAHRLKDYPGVQVAARLGGDEYAVALDLSLSESELDKAFAGLHALLNEDIEWEGERLSIGASIGYATRTKDASTLSMLLKAADTAMRRAKGEHKGWVRFDPDIDGGALDYQSQEIKFRSALACGNLSAAIQPIANASTLEIVGFELFSRWTDPGPLTLPEPTEFIPIAERLGLLNELLWKTLDETLKSAELTPQRLSVNIAPAQLQTPDFLERFLNLLTWHGVNPSSMTLEVTEQVAYRNMEANIQVLEKARRAGMLIALDNFGTGYSSLSMLNKLPLDKIKIDRSFSQQLGNNDRTDSILRSSICLAGELKLICCVEGIETEAAARKAALLGAKEIQGYWIGKPRIVQDIGTRLKLVS